MLNRLFTGLFVAFLFTGQVFAQRAYQGYQYHPDHLEVNTNDGKIHITPYGASSFRVDFLANGEALPFPVNAAAGAPERTETKVKETDTQLIYSVDDLSVILEKKPFHLSFVRDGKVILSEEKGFFDQDSVAGFRFELQDNEKLIGGGERVLGMDRRGHRLELYNRASYGYEKHAELMYYSMPMLVSSEKYALIFDNGAKGFLDLGATESNILQFEAMGGNMSYFVVAGEDYPELMNNFTALTGRNPMPARWTLGNIASRMGYHSQEEVEMTAGKYKTEEIPLDGIVIDLFWQGKDLTGHMGNLDWEPDSFPQPEQMMANLKEDGVKTILITEPFILTNCKTWDSAVENKVLGTDTLGNPYKFDFFFGNTGLVDIFKPEAKDWFWSFYKKHTDAGVGGWWGDLGEPEVHPAGLQHVNGSADEVHNIYGHEWAKMVYDGYAKDFPNERPLILMRSGFVGSQRYGLVPWTGDVNRTWGGLWPQVELSLSMGLQGAAYMSSDLGGFAGTYEDPELYLRWLQFGVFNPVYRTHAQEEVPAEPVFWDVKTKAIAREFIRLRYQMMPYNYTLAYDNHTTGMPLMRPLFFEEDRADLIDYVDAYMWGDAFLVAPVREKGQQSKKLYLPIGHRWFTFDTDQVFDGGQEISLPTNIKHLPVMVKAGSFVPMAEVFQSTEFYNTEKLTLHYFADPSVEEAKGEMYEDDGHSKDAIAKGDFQLLKFEADQVGDALKIALEKTGKGYVGAPAERQTTLIVHQSPEAKKVSVNGEKVKVQKSKEKWAAKGGAFYDEASKQLHLTVAFNDKVDIVIN
ncbi:TIM-barrel domain-containing protein [Persicobacter diffluens]|uniref:Alpha-glucosidase n=1 Tax=Persicobacter diffluens TaxID=981 RepID=A0AAN4VWZ2_9BACT|nr:alpha-glucosidase [Persicobacter diffluens]